MAQGMGELLWLKNHPRSFIDKMGRAAGKLYCANISAISIAHNPVQFDRTKHKEVDIHFVKEKLDSGLICTPHMSSQNQFCRYSTLRDSTATILKGSCPNWEWITQIS